MFHVAERIKDASQSEPLPVFSCRIRHNSVQLKVIVLKRLLITGSAFEDMIQATEMHGQQASRVATVPRGSN